jgi:phosphatidate phosphatase APP1
MSEQREVAQQPHPAARFEDLAGRVLTAPLRRVGWRPRPIAYTGYGGTLAVRVLGRVLLSPPKPKPPGRGWRAFFSVPVPRWPVVVEIGDHRHELRTDRGGYLDAVVPVDLAPGWHPVTLLLPGGARAGASVRIVADGTANGVVSDIDDTVLVTWLPRPLVAARNTFLLAEDARRPVAGMATLLGELAGGPHDPIVVYLSTGAWNVAPALERFLRRHGYPPGPLLLTDWGPTRTGWFRDGRAHKLESLRRLAREFPQVRWVLVGDDGQHDPAVYARFAAERPAAVRAVAIRQLSAEVREPTAASDAPVWVSARDGSALARRLRERGIR